MDSVEFLNDLKVADYSKLVLQPLDTMNTRLPPKDENTYESASNILKLTDGILLTEIPGKLTGIEVSDKMPETASLDKALVLRGKIEEIHPGSRAERYWVGFGAGSAWVKVSGEITDARSGQAFLRFEQQRVGAMGFFGGDYDAMLKDCVVEIGRDIGHMLACLH